MISTDTEVGGLLVLWNGEGMKKSDGVGAVAGSVCLAATVNETTNFTSVGFLPPLLAGTFA